MLDNLRFTQLEAELSERLQRDLPAGNFYHNLEHTLDVMAAAVRIARSEGVSDVELLLLKIAALFHDAGYLVQRHEHEAASCRIAREYLSRYGLDEASIQQVERMILATRVPQEPSDKLSEILCDADLDYLGRDDYFELAARLYDEFLLNQTVKTEAEWLDMQVNFLAAHRYFSETALRTRDAGRLAHLAKLQAQRERSGSLS